RFDGARPQSGHSQDSGNPRRRHPLGSGVANVPPSASIERRRKNRRRSPGRVRLGDAMKTSAALLLSAFCLLPSGCRTVGVSKTSGGYAEIAPTIAAEMILDSQQIVVIDVRPSSAYRGPEGHIPGAISAPFETIEMRLPELLPYQNQTVL